MNSKAKNTVKIVICPQCNGESIFATSNVYRPFCSERCKNIDLGAWANESFRIEAKVPLDDQVYRESKLQ
jgi:uncharacterized protein